MTTQSPLVRPLFIGSEIYRGSSYGAWHPLRVPRVSTVMDLSRALGWLPAQQYITSPRAKPVVISAWHTPTYIAALQAAEAAQGVSEEVRRRHHIGTHSNPVFAEVFRRPATSAGGALLAGELLANGGRVYAPGCGTHHAMPDRANGFCYFNDPVLSILSLKRSGVKRIAYIDIDAHHPDGVEHAFEADPDVLMISTHEENRWPRTGALGHEGVGNLFNLPLPKHSHDDDMAYVLSELILPALQTFRPDAIVLQCGADAVEEDPQSTLAMSNNAHFDVIRALLPVCPRFLLLGGGGYNPWSVGRLWTGAWGVLNGIDPPRDLDDAPRRVLEALTWSGHSRAKNRPAHWSTTLRDDPRNGPVKDVVRERVGKLKKRLLVHV